MQIEQIIKTNEVNIGSVLLLKNGKKLVEPTLFMLYSL